MTCGKHQQRRKNFLKKTFFLLKFYIIYIYRDVNAVDDQFMKHKCPIFNKYVICASGYTSEVKKEIKNLIEAQGILKINSI